MQDFVLRPSPSACCRRCRVAGRRQGEDGGENTAGPITRLFEGRAASRTRRTTGSFGGRKQEVKNQRPGFARGGSKSGDCADKPRRRSRASLGERGFREPQSLPGQNARLRLRW